MKYSVTTETSTEQFMVETVWPKILELDKKLEFLMNGAINSSGSRESETAGIDFREQAEIFRMEAIKALSIDLRREIASSIKSETTSNLDGIRRKIASVFSQIETTDNAILDIREVANYSLDWSKGIYGMFRLYIRTSLSIQIVLVIIVLINLI
ncbi:MAG: hypothetical protein IKS22_04255 [Bacteroidales bacterium]|nr:hypothetical protein [Bacteroidales bacterium]